jgi:hypothetical protein
VLPDMVHPIVMGVTVSTGHLRSCGYQGLGKTSRGGTMSDHVAPSLTV